MVIYIVLSLFSASLAAAENSRYGFVIGGSDQADRIAEINNVMAMPSHGQVPLPQSPGNHIIIRNGRAQDETGETIQLRQNASLNRLRAEFASRRRIAAMQREIAANNRQLAINERQIARLQREQTRLRRIYRRTIKQERQKGA